MEKKLTILDIARLSGVGKSTVSRVLNQDPKVNAQTRARVESVIAQHGFVPSKSARAMRSQSQQVVGIVVSRLDSSSENQAVRGMLETLYQRGYDAVLMESKFSPAKVSEHLAVLERRGVDGIILFAFNDLDYAAMAPLREKLVLVARDHPGFSSVCFDDAGAVRMGMAFLSGGKVRVLYRSKPGDPLREIAKITEDNFDDTIWDVLRITQGSDEGLVLKPGPDGWMAVRKFNYATREVGEVVFSVPGWDVDEATVDDKGQLIAAFHTDDRDRVTWFDPKMKALYARLGKALAGQQVWVTSRAKDDSRMLVWAGSESNPGQTFLYDAAKRTMDGFDTALPDLDAALTATPKPVSYTTRDKHTIFAYLTLPRGRQAKGLPLIIMPHGGPYGVRDKLEFDSLVQLLANRGYAVLQPNYRGSGGYGKAFSELGAGQIGRAMQDDLDDAMDWAVAQGIADPKRVCMAGASYGGYAALWAVIRNPERYRCAVSFAGVTDWKRQLKYDANFFTRKGAKKWMARVQGEDPNFSLDLVSPVPQIARLTRPVLLSHGDEDTNVPFKQFTLLRDAAAKAGKPIETMVFAGEGHGFDKDENEERWYAAIEAFLAKHNPAD